MYIYSSKQNVKYEELYFTFNFELENFIKTFTFNGHPKYFLNKFIRCFVDKIFCSDPKVSFAPKKIIYSSLPSTGQDSLQIRNQIRRLCSSALSHISIRFLFHSSPRLSLFPPFKDRVLKGLRPRIVYRFKCRLYFSIFLHTSSVQR